MFEVGMETCDLLQVETDYRLHVDSLKLHLGVQIQLGLTAVGLPLQDFQMAQLSFGEKQAILKTIHQQFESI